MLQCKCKMDKKQASHCLYHDYVIKWKHFLCYWPYCDENLPMDSPDKVQWRGAWCFHWYAPEQTIEQTLIHRWFETSSRTLWRRCCANNAPFHWRTNASLGLISKYVIMEQICFISISFVKCEVVVVSSSHFCCLNLVYLRYIRYGLTWQPF